MPKPNVRVLLPNRYQLELRPSDLDALLAEGHEPGWCGATSNSKT
jgi:hypothetical protein